MFGRGAHCELVHVSLAEHYRACCVEPLHNCSIVWWFKIFEHVRATGGSDPICANQVFDSQGYACERRQSRTIL